MKKDKLLFLFALLLTTVGYDKDTISSNEEIEYKKKSQTTDGAVAWDFFLLCRHLDSNQGPPPCQGDTLTS